MIYITGDTHGLRDTQRFTSAYFLRKVNKPENYLIITGDSGITWNEQTMQKCLDFYGKFKCKILFVDGNNDNFDILNKLPIEDFCGGKVHKVSDNILHLMRGNIFNIEGKKILAFGGANSWDAYRKFHYKEDEIYYPGKGNRFEHKNWWQEEQPSKEEFMLALKNLKENDNKVDLIITHETTTKNIKNTFNWSIHKQTCKMLDLIYRKTDFKYWFFGHHHHDVNVSKVERCVYEDFIKIDNLENTKYKSEYKSLEIEKQTLSKRQLSIYSKEN